MCRNHRERFQLYRIRREQAREASRPRVRSGGRTGLRSTAAVFHQKTAAYSRRVDDTVKLHCDRLFDSVSTEPIQEVFYSAVLVEAGLIDRSADDVRRLIRRCEERPSGLIIDYVYTHAARGALCLIQLEYECAQHHFEKAAHFRDDLEDRYVAAYCVLGIARCARQSGQYKLAQAMAAEAAQLALDCGSSETAAVADIVDAWSHYKLGKYDEAVEMLLRSKKLLEPTDDWISRGNIMGALGRIEGKIGDAERALELYASARECFDKTAGHQRAQAYAARVLINAARQSRILAKRLMMKAADRRRARALQDEALSGLLPRAEAFYAEHPHPRGRGGVLLVRGWIMLDRHDWQGGVEAAREAWGLAQDRQDHILSASALTLWARALVTAVDLMIEDEDPDRRTLAVRRKEALRRAGEAVYQARAAGKTSRMLADSYVALALAKHVNGQGGGDAYRLADELAEKGREPHLRDEVKRLRRRIFPPADAGDQKLIRSLFAEIHQLTQEGAPASTLRKKIVDYAIVCQWLKLTRERLNGPTQSEVARILGVKLHRVREALIENGLRSRANGDPASGT